MPARPYLQHGIPITTGLGHAQSGSSGQGGAATDTRRTPLLLEDELSRLESLGAQTTPRAAQPSAVAVAARPIGRYAPSTPDKPVQVAERPLRTSWLLGIDWGRLSQRALEMLPGLTTLFIITSLIWGALLAPRWLAIFLLAFDGYWVWRSFNTAFHTVKGQFLVRREQRTDWRSRYEAECSRVPDALAWEDVRHVVIIPNYKESVNKLQLTLRALAAQEEAQEKLFIVLAMEGTEARAIEKAALLKREFQSCFAGILVTFHPPNIPGEVRGKSSNEAWAARQAKRWLVDELGYDLRHLTVTSCDADTIFHPRYFSALTCKFALAAKRYRRFWQAPIFLHNNIWDVPAPLRVPNSLASRYHLAQLSRRFRMVFPQSTYSLSFQMAHEVDYWDVDIVPEDWHMFLKCFFQLGGEVDVEPIYLPMKMDGARSHSYLRTFLNHYQQARRHAWGASDVPYAVRCALQHPEIPLLRRLRRVWSVYETHVMWASPWFLITGPELLFGTVLGLNLTPAWFADLMPPWFREYSRTLLLSCLFPLLTMITCDALSRPPRPKHFGVRLLAFQFAQWFLMAPITFVFNALPAVDAQLRLLLGKRLEYKVTEKA